MQIKTDLTPNWVRTKTILEFLDVSENTLAAMTRKHGIKPVKLLGANYYNLHKFESLFETLKHS